MAKTKNKTIFLLGNLIKIVLLFYFTTARNSSSDILMYMKNIYFLIFIAIFAALPLSVNAIGFGGRIIATIPCNLGTSVALFITTPTPGAFLYIPGVSTLYKNYNLSPSRWVLGNFSPGGICTIGVCPFCVAIPMTGTIQQVGTS